PGAPAAPAALPDIALPQARLTGAVIAFHDRRTGRRERIEDLDLTLSAPALDAPATAAGEGRWRDAPLTLQAEAATPAALLRGDTAALSAQLQASGLSLVWDGAARLPRRGGLPTLAGRAALTAEDPAGALALVGVAPPPAAGVLAALSAQAEIDLSPQALSLTAAVDLTRDGAPAALRLTVVGAERWLRRREADVTLTLSQTGLGDLTWDGRLAAPARGGPQATGRLTAASARPLQALAALGVAAPAEAGDVRDLTLAADLDVSRQGLAAEIAVDATRDGAPASARATLAGAQGWMRARRVAVDAAVEARGLVRAAFDGEAAAPAGRPPRLDGQVSLGAEDLRALMALAGASPKGLGKQALRRASLEARATVQGRSIRLRDARMALDDLRLSGDLDVAAVKRLKIEGRLEAGPLDLRPYMGGGGGAGRKAGAAGGRPDRGGTAGGGWSKAPIDLSALRGLDARVALTAPSLTLPDLATGALDVAVTVQRGEARLSLRDARAFGGRLSGVATAKATKAAPVSARLEAEGVALRPLLRALAGSDRIEGVGSLSLDVKGGARSLHALMNSLNGEARVRLRDGALLGVNLAAMARNVTSAFLDAEAGAARKTDFASIEASFQGRKGRFRSEDLAFVGPLLRIGGAGLVDLGGRTLDWRLEPKAVATLKGQGGRRDAAGLSVPVLVDGPWAAPRFAPDVEGLATSTGTDRPAASRRPPCPFNVATALGSNRQSNVRPPRS
ncbi:MAG: AsmA-like C-terminal region-containing protein, partial [Pseudomonadota bacterium]